MPAAVNAAAAKAALERWAAAMQASAPELNELDARLGDGDLGATLDKCAANVRAALPGMPNALDGVFKACAQACAKASGSSFGTLLAQAFVAAAKRCAGQDVLAASEFAPLLNEIIAVLSARGGARLGDKTMLDSLSAVAAALAGGPGGAPPAEAAVAAAQQALERFRERPNKVGRARMFADRSIGLDDPGMVAVLRMTQSFLSPRLVH
ncbi:MAG TPA: DAK2 domain-containing protein [Ramlibacter sp.]|nr:DAK2 domain-containing protein [Ramlibacter sp.]